MGKFKLTIGGKQFNVEAPNKDSLPEIAETIAKQQNVQPKEAESFQSAIPSVKGFPTPEGEVEFKQTRDPTLVEQVKETQRLFNPKRQDLKSFLTKTELENRDRIQEASKPMRRIGQFGIGVASGATGGSQRLIPEELREAQEAQDANENLSRVMGEIVGFGIGPAKVLTAVRQGVINRLGTSVGAKWLGSVLAGGTVGFLETPSDSARMLEGDLAQRGLQGAVSGLTFGAFDLAGAALNKLGKSFIGLKQLSKQPKLSSTESSLKLAKEKLKGLTEETVAKGDVAFKESEAAIKTNIMLLKNQIEKESRAGSLRVRKLLPRWYKNNSAIYGKRLDDIDDVLLKTKANFNKGDVNGILQSTKRELQEAGISEGKTLKIIDNLIDNKYGTTELSKQFTLREIINDVKTVRSSARAAFKSGSSKATTEDLAVGIFNKNWGTLVEQKAPALKALNKQYGPVIDLMKESNKTFKPFKSDFEKDIGEKFLSKFAQGDVTANQKRFINLLQKSSKFGPGTGKQTQVVEEAGKRLLAAEKQLQSIPPMLKQKELRKLDLIRRQFEPQISQLELQQNVTQQLLENSKVARGLGRLLARASLVVAGKKLLFDPAVNALQK